MLAKLTKKISLAKWSTNEKTNEMSKTSNLEIFYKGMCVLNEKDKNILALKISLKTICKSHFVNK